MELFSSKIKNFFIFAEIELSSLTFFLYFWKWNCLAPTLKIVLYFRKKLAKPEKKKIHIFRLFRDNFSNISTKEKSFV